MTNTRLLCVKLAVILTCWSTGLSVIAQTVPAMRAGSYLAARNRQAPSLPPEAAPNISGEIIPSPVEEMSQPAAPNSVMKESFSGPPPVVHHENWSSNPILEEEPVADHLPAMPWSSGDWFRNGGRYAELDFLVVTRVRNRNERTLLGIDLTAPGLAITTMNHTFGTEPGMRFTFGQYLARDYLNRDHSLEFTFLGVNEFGLSDGLRSRGGNGLQTPVNQFIAGFNFADEYSLEHDTRLMSYEVNYQVRHRLDRDRIVMSPDGSWSRQYTQGHNTSFLIGMRYVSFDEDFLWTSRRTGVPVGTFGGDYTVNAENDLLGLQLGGEMVDQYETWNWGIRGKAGAYVNFIDVTQTIAINGVNVFATSPAQHDAAFIGELGLFSSYHLTPNWTLRLGYDMYWLGGVASAPNQVDFRFNPKPHVNSNSLVNLHALSFGTELTW